MHFAVTFDDEAPVAADKSVMYREGQIPAVIFF